MTLSSQARERLAANLADVRARIADAAARSGRAPDAVTLIGVTKYVGADVARALVAAGLADLGESRPQQLWEKAEALRGLPPRWHLIGQLQRNKIRRTLPEIAWLHSGDRWRLLEAVERELAGAAEQLDDDANHAPQPCNVLLEVNVSGDPTKHGFVADDLPPLLPQLAKLTHIRIRGLMAMAGRTAAEDEVRQQFAALRVLRDRLQTQQPELQLDQLSMGMSGDFELAIEEGATMVRVGSALFVGVDDD